MHRRSVEVVTSPNDLPADLPRTVGELKASGHRERGIKTEIRENLLAALADGDDVWPGIFGFEDTVLPQLERALIAGHGLGAPPGRHKKGASGRLFC